MVKDCFSRGLLREALGQLAGLKRRKLAMGLLAAAVQSGLNKRDAEGKQLAAVGADAAAAAASKVEGGTKRSRDETETVTGGELEETTEEPAAKKSRTEVDVDGS
jgi:hypothetical protein